MLYFLVEENNWTRLGPINPSKPIWESSLKPIYLIEFIQIQKNFLHSIK